MPNRLARSESTTSPIQPIPSSVLLTWPRRLLTSYSSRLAKIEVAESHEELLKNWP